MATTNTNGTFKISQLPKITNINDDDLLLVSDSENEKFYTKSMSIKQISDKIVDSVANNSNVINAIISNPEIISIIEETVNQVVNQAINSNISADVLKTIENNSGHVLDILDGSQDGEFVLDGNIEGSN